MEAKGAADKPARFVPFSQEDLDHRFNYHPPQTEARANAHSSVRSACRILAEHLARTLPSGRELATALTNLEQVMFWANAALARHPDNLEKR